MRTGARRFERSCLWTQRKLISAAESNNSRAQGGSIGGRTRTVRPQREIPECHCLCQKTGRAWSRASHRERLLQHADVRWNPRDEGDELPVCLDANAYVPVCEIPLQALRRWRRPRTRYEADYRELAGALSGFAIRELPQCNCSHRRVHSPDFSRPLAPSRTGGCSAHLRNSFE